MKKRLRFLLIRMYVLPIAYLFIIIATIPYAIMKDGFFKSCRDLLYAFEFDLPMMINVSKNSWKVKNLDELNRLGRSK